MKTKVRIENKYGVKLYLKKKIERLVDYLFEIEDIKKNASTSGFDAESIAFDILYTDDEEIHDINRQYRKKDSPTDVITFALFTDCDNKFIFNDTIELGEIIVSIDTAKRQAKESLEKEVLTLICHGILHLLGFDHLTDKDYNFVVSIQDTVISKL